MFKEQHRKEFLKESQEIFETYFNHRFDIDYGIHIITHEEFVKNCKKLIEIIGHTRFTELNEAVTQYNLKKRREGIKNATV